MLYSLTPLPWRAALYILHWQFETKGTFKQLLDTCTTANMDALCQRYDGFYRFAKLLERLAEGIADGSITEFYR